MDEKLKRAQLQRFVALVNAFATIDAFAIPSLNPDLDEKYREVKKNLLLNYAEGIDPKELDQYTYGVFPSFILHSKVQTTPTKTEPHHIKKLQHYCQYSKEYFGPDETVWVLSIQHLPNDEPLAIKGPEYRGGANLAYFHTKEGAIRWKKFYMNCDYFCPISKEGFEATDEVWLIKLDQATVPPQHISALGSIYSLRKESALFHTREAAIGWQNENYHN